MEKLKPLDQLTEPDPRQRAFVRFDASSPTGTRPTELADRYRPIAELELSPSVPDTVRSAFAVVRNLWLYGWFHWPFYTLAELHAYLCLDMALAIKIASIEGITDPEWRSPSMTAMMKRAIKERWITDDGIPHAKRSKEAARAVRKGLPEEMRSTLAESPWDTSDQHYCEILLEVIPKIRDKFAHPKSYWHGGPEAFLALEDVHALIEQLFPALEQQQTAEIPD